MPSQNEANIRYFRRHVITFSFLGSLYIIIGCLVFFGPSQLINFMNIFPNLFQLFQAIPKDLNGLWILLSGSYLLTLAVLCFLSASYPKGSGYRMVLLFSTLLSGVGFILLFKDEAKYFAYLVCGIFQLLVSLIVVWTSIMGFFKKPFAEPQKTQKNNKKAPPPIMHPLPQN